MTHFTTPEFWQYFDLLPDDIKTLAKKKFNFLKDNPRHPSIHFKKAGKYWTARIGIHRRAISKERSAGLNWFSGGHHSASDHLLS
jgi:hypothetical protein